MRKTKIICTVGPASDSEDILRELMLKGMNIARLNFSHGSHEEHQKKIDLIKCIREDLNLPVALLLDTKGPEIRTGSFEKGKVTLVQGEKITILHNDVPGTEKEFSITYKSLHQDVSIGTKILIDDGLIELNVEKISGKDIICRIENGGDISTKKSINVPGVELQLPATTEKDREDILFAIKNDFDFIAASFVRKARDVQEIRSILENNGGSDINVISKIENGEGVTHLEDILKVSDGIMVARGDLGVEIPAAEVPIVQKKAIKLCQNLGKISITATQMLDSMMRNPRPTRAEVSDVANAIFDGTSAVMLSGETAAGKYPIESLQMMVEIARQTERAINYWKKLRTSQQPLITTVANAISHATCTTAMDLNAKAIVTITHAGRTARLVSRFRPACPIIATTVFPKIQRQLNMCWGICPVLVDEVQTTDGMFAVGLKAAESSEFLEDGDIIVMTGGTPVGMSGTTNTIKVEAIGHSLVNGKGQNFGEGVPSKITGTAIMIKDPENLPAIATLPEKYIVVAPYTNNNMMILLKKAVALVVEDDDLFSHSATVSAALEIPALLSCDKATRLIKDGKIITVDTERGLVY